MPSKVIVFCPILEFKNKPCTLMSISPQGYYEVRVDMAAGNHTVYLPIAGTAVIFQDPNVTGEIPPDVERYG
ncbi:MAG TPA: hypothetical protein VMH79_15325 [Thermoanaerobaculia bacterium]|nr:hypothetical protein [Thermoanaerobaculia bacterium]